LSGKNTVDSGQFVFFVLKNTGIFLDIFGKDCFPSSSMNGRWDVVGETFWNLSVFSQLRPGKLPPWPSFKLGRARRRRIIAMTQQYHEHLLEAGEKPSSSDSWPWRWILRALAFLVALALALGFLNDGKAAPGPLKYLYISFHGDGSATTPLPQYGVNQIFRFDLENLGDPAQPVLGKGSPTPPRMLRDMQILKDGTLFVAQGLKFDSCILQYGPCDQDGVRQGVTKVIFCFSGCWGNWQLVLMFTNWSI